MYSGNWLAASVPSLSVLRKASHRISYGCHSSPHGDMRVGVRPGGLSAWHEGGKFLYVTLSYPSIVCSFCGLASILCVTLRVYRFISSAVRDTMSFMNYPG